MAAFQDPAAPEATQDREGPRPPPLVAPVLRPVALFAAVALAFLGNGLLGTLVSVRATLEGIGDAVIGLIMSSFFLGYFAGSVIAPRIIQRVGHIRSFAALASIASGLALALPIFVDPLAWVALRLASGACFAGMLIVVESWLNAAAPTHLRGRTLAVYNIVVYLAWAGSQQLLPLAPAAGFTLFCLVSILFSFSLVPVTLSRADMPGTVLARRSGLRQLVAISPTAVAGAVALGAGMGAFWGMAPSWGEQVGLARESLATLLGLVLLGALVLQWPLGWLSDLVDRRVVLGASLLVAAGAALALMQVDPGRTGLLFALAAALGAFAMPGYALCVAHANDQVDREELVAVSSALILLYGAGSAAGPFLAGLAMTHLGPSALFGVVAACLLAAGLYAATRRLAAPAAPDRRKADYVAVPQTSHTALSMHREGTGEPDLDRAPT